MPVNRTTLTMLFVGVLSLVALFTVGHLRHQATRTMLAAAELTHSGSQDIALAHLWIEEALAGDANIEFGAHIVVPIDNALEALDRADKTLTTEGLEDLHPHLSQLKMAIGQWRQLALERWQHRQEDHRAGDVSDQRFDQLFERILGSFRDIASQSTQVLQRHTDRLGLLNDGILAILGILIVAAIGFVGRDQNALVQRQAELEKRTLDLVTMAARAEDAGRAKTNFLATMSHEIRTPLNAVLGMTHLLTETPLDTNQQELAQTIRTSGEALLHLVNDILDFSKTEAGKLDLEHLPFLLRDCIEDAAEVCAPAAAAKGIELLIDCPSEADVEIVGDNGRLRQVLLNIIANAVKFTDKGHVTVGAALLQTTPGHAKITLVVKDSGIGIAQEKLQSLFESFTQADSSTTRKYGGSGLGLAIARQIMTRMNGSVSVESTVGAGSTFTILLPTQLGTGAPEALGGLEPTRALLVEDSARVRELLEDQLTQWGVTVVSANTASSALQQLDNEQDMFDFAIVDETLPGLDGVDLAAKVRASGSTLPMALLSTTPGKGARRPDLFRYIVSKPVRKRRLLEIVKGLTRPLPVPTTRRSEPESPLNLRILVAEDNPVNQRVAVLMLDKLGYRADVVENGNDAVRAVQQKPYDLVLMDIQMPGLDGVGATRRIRSLLNLTRQPQIFAMTADAFKEDELRCKEAGMDGVITKPIDLDKLKAILADKDLPAPPPQALHDDGGNGFAQSVWNELVTIGALNDVLRSYQLDLPNRLMSLRDAWRTQSSDKLLATAHIIKGASRSAGALGLANICERLESEVRAGKLASCQDLVAQAHGEAQQLLRVLAKYFATQA
jgi:signal transduction histidine kinase/CheY-like chemotaxis protein